jgi:hypothetical protein
MDFLDQLKALGSELVSLARDGISFAKEGLPILVTQAARYWTIMAWLDFCLTFIFSVLFAIIGYNIYKRGLYIKTYDQIIDKKEHDRVEKLYYSDQEITYFVFAIISIVVSACIFIGFLLSISPAIKSVTAPSLFFLEKAAQLFR